MGSGFPAHSRQEAQLLGGDANLNVSEIPEFLSRRRLAHVSLGAASFASAVCVWAQIGPASQPASITKHYSSQLNTYKIPQINKTGLQTAHVVL